MRDAPRFHLAGERGLLVELGTRIDPSLSNLARTLSARIEEWPEVEEAVPSYAGVLVLYDPLATTMESLRGRIAEAWTALGSKELPPSRTVLLPVAYGGTYGPDLEAVADHTGFSADEVLRRHASALYLVHLIGFTPGFPYLGGLPPELATPRLPTPRTRVPAGSVGIAGSQTGVYSLESPGGWRLIGRTPTLLFDPRRDPPSLLRAGDRLRFRPLASSDFPLLAEASARGESTWEEER